MMLVGSALEVRPSVVASFVFPSGMTVLQMRGDMSFKTKCVWESMGVGSVFAAHTYRQFKMSTCFRFSGALKIQKS